MTGAVAPVPSPAASVGQTWARLFGVPEASVAAVADAYEARVTEPRVWAVQGSWCGEPAVIARLDNTHVLATPTGYHLAYLGPRQSGVPLSRAVRWPLRRNQIEAAFTKAASYIAAVYERYQENPSKVHMSSFGTWARTIAAALVQSDLTAAFAAAMSRTDALLLFRAASPKAERSYHSARVPFYLRQLGASLRLLRTVLPAPVRSALWAVGIYDFRLASWLMESETHRLYRLQALRVQPMLLPLALLSTPYESDPGNGALAKAKLADERPGSEHSEPALARALLHAIDSGKPWFEELHALLAVMMRQSWAPPVPLAGIRWLAGRSPRFLRWTRDADASLPHLLAAASRLPGNRQPSRARDWRVFTSFARKLPMEEFSPSLLKGMPCDWTEDPWPTAAGSIDALRDAIMWAAGDTGYWLETSLIWTWLLRNATLRQMLNYSTAAHELRAAEESAMRREWQNRSEATVRWDGALPARVFHHKKLVISELTTAAELEDEGLRLTHCIGSYAYACVAGDSRIFSVRTQTGNSLSSFEVFRRTGRAGVLELALAQHAARKNNAPARECNDAVTAFLQAARLHHIAVSLDWPRGLMPSDQRRLELDRRVRDVVSRELFRRWPALRPHLLTQVHSVLPDEAQL